MEGPHLPQAPPGLMPCAPWRPPWPARRAQQPWQRPGCGRRQLLQQRTSSAPAAGTSPAARCERIARRRPQRLLPACCAPPAAASPAHTPSCGQHHVTQHTALALVVGMQAFRFHLRCQAGHLRLALSCLLFCLVARSGLMLCQRKRMGCSLGLRSLLCCLQLLLQLFLSLPHKKCVINMLRLSKSSSLRRACMAVFLHLQACVHN